MKTFVILYIFLNSIMMCGKFINIAVFVVLQICTLVQSEDPPGHMQPLGSHMPPIEVEVRDNVPDPVEFFKDYIKPGIPVVLKGAAKDFKNYKTWKDDEYLRDNYGNWSIGVEVGKYEGAVFGRYIYVPFRFFLEKYKEREYYLITDITEENPMRDEIMLPKAMACGGFAELTLEALILFSSGSTQSALHWDDVENMHCVLDGTKEWIMFDRELRDRIPIMKKFEAYGAMDCRKVDMYKYPVVQELPWHHASLEAGDCLYVPHGWPHHVRSDGNVRSMALAVWFGPVYKINMTDCPEDLSQLPDKVPLGRRVMSKLSNLRNSLAFSLDEEEEITKDEFLEVASESANETAAIRAYNALDKDRDGSISLEEMENVNEEIDLLSDIFVKKKEKRYEESGEKRKASHSEL